VGAAHEPEALGGGISREIIEIIKHRNDTNGLDEADAIVIELGREIFRREEGSVGDLRPVITPVRRRALRSISLPSWAIMLGQQHFSPPSRWSWYRSAMIKVGTRDAVDVLFETRVRDRPNEFPVRASDQMKPARTSTRGRRAEGSLPGRVQALYHAALQAIARSLSAKAYGPMCHV